MSGKKPVQAITNDHNNMTTNDDDDDDVEVDRPAECGIGRIKPTALQKCANISVFTGTYCFSALLTSTLSVYVKSQVR